MLVDVAVGDEVGVSVGSGAVSVEVAVTVGAAVGSPVAVGATMGVGVEWEVGVVVGVGGGRAVCVAVGAGSGESVGKGVTLASAKGSAETRVCCPALEDSDCGGKASPLGAPSQAEIIRSATVNMGSESRSIISGYTVLSRSGLGLPARGRQFGKQAIPLGRT